MGSKNINNNYNKQTEPGCVKWVAKKHQQLEQATSTGVSQMDGKNIDNTNNNNNNGAS
jgi:hypothetical protein